MKCPKCASDNDIECESKCWKCGINLKDHVELDEFEWAEVYKPLMDEDTGESLRQFEWGSPEEIAFIREAISECRCWTMIQGDEDGLYIVPGNRAVNRMHNVITEVPWPHPDIEVVWWDPDDMTDEEE